MILAVEVFGLALVAAVARQQPGNTALACGKDKRPLEVTPATFRALAPFPSPNGRGAHIHFYSGLFAGVGCAAAAGLPFSHNPGGTWAAGMKMGLSVGQNGINSGW